MRPLRLLSVHAHALPADPGRLARLVAAAEPDVACVHGAPSLLRWRSKCAALARRAGMVVVAGGRTGGGTLLLATLGVDELAVHDLALGSPLGVRPPGAAVAMLGHAGRRFVLAGGRLDAGPAGAGQASALLTAIEAFAPSRPPALLCVEGAHRPGTQAWRVLGAGHEDVGSGVFVDPRVTVSALEDFAPRGPGRSDAIARDRRPLRMELDF